LLAVVRRQLSSGIVAEVQLPTIRFVCLRIQNLEGMSTRLSMDTINNLNCKLTASYPSLTIFSRTEVRQLPTTQFVCLGIQNLAGMSTRLSMDTIRNQISHLPSATLVFQFSFLFNCISFRQLNLCAWEFKIWQG
jgi:hypothetical protein